MFQLAIITLTRVGRLSYWRYFCRYSVYHKSTAFYDATRGPRPGQVDLAETYTKTETETKTKKEMVVNTTGDRCLDNTG